MSRNCTPSALRTLLTYAATMLRSSTVSGRFGSLSKDNGRPRPEWFYRDALTFYRKAMIRPGSKVLVMCRAGRRRSASMTYFLLRASGVRPCKAERTIRRARPCAQIVRAYRESGEQSLYGMTRWQDVKGDVFVRSHQLRLDTDFTLRSISRFSERKWGLPGSLTRSVCLQTFLEKSHSNHSLRPATFGQGAS